MKVIMQSSIVQSVASRSRGNVRVTFYEQRVWDFLAILTSTLYTNTERIARRFSFKRGKTWRFGRRIALLKKYIFTPYISRLYAERDAALATALAILIRDFSPSQSRLSFFTAILILIRHCGAVILCYILARGWQRRRDRGELEAAGERAALSHAYNSAISTLSLIKLT